MISLLAEIGDKMPPVTGTAVIACVIALIAVWLGSIRRWMALLPLPVIALYNLIMWGELQEPGFGRLIITELGWGWVVGQFAAWNVPFVVAILVVMFLPQRHRMPGHCARCGYNLVGNTSGRCPECGTAKRAEPSNATDMG